MSRRFDVPWHNAAESDPISSLRTRIDVDRKSTCYNYRVNQTGERNTSVSYRSRHHSTIDFLTVDTEEAANLPRYLSGYPSLAAFIASDRDLTTLIYKRFNRLAARHLLHLQSELAELQAQQDQFDQDDLYSDLETKQYSRNWPEFCEAAEHDGKQKGKKDLGKDIGAKLKEYSAHSGTLFDDPDDLVALRAREDRDVLTAVAQDHLAWLFQTRGSYGNIAYSSDRRIAQFVAVLSTINAAALLIGAIVSLYAVASPKKKLGIIAVFTRLFATNIGILTNARRAELFAACAGYAAVLVVFRDFAIIPDRDMNLLYL
ncbi:hypothetical protein BDV95DRAFT_598925 [Massariosphaeria phaeospora]|uniref:DUF6594 domain-containing protein n=1 Tax=Massariosphaeria phaeospora TaxID=100035 RepID=A0A7C8I7D3_9PLEO|nr:hypothetical protein BDV95DRAFT_598925 [Massariosphaeria phaeospora]